MMSSIGGRMGVCQIMTVDDWGEGGLIKISLANGTAETSHAAKLLRIGCNKKVE